MMKAVGSAASVVVLALGGAAPAVAKSHRHHHKHHSHAKRHSTHASSAKSGSDSSTSPSNGEVALAGTDLSSAEAAAIAANPGATAIDATTETDSSISGAAYEVHIKQADGTPAVVIEDSSFTVLATQAAPAGPGGFGHPHP
jgi:hypothetical protein